MRNRENGASGELRADGCLDDGVRLQIDSGRGLVQNQHRRLVEQRPRQADQLSLSDTASDHISI